MKKVLTLLALLGSFNSAFAQKTPALPALERVEPMFWWAGMKTPDLQLLVHGTNIASSQVSLTYPGVTLRAVNKVENPNYLFLDLTIAPDAKAGTFPITFAQGRKKLTYTYELRAKDTAKNRIQGVTPADFIYLIMPDRFANGDPTNDIVPGTNEAVINRDSMFYRHGGDLRGITNHLDYLKDLGVTALWLNPALENNQPKASYHGYAFTDHYRIDPRLGTNEDYRTLAEQCHANGMKLIMDLVHNHVGNQHWFIRDLPAKDWLHQWDTFTRTTYKDPTLVDPYAAAADRKLMSDGWFDTHMPDLNQQNPYLANYLIQNNLWWIEYAGLDGYRLDTYAYNDLDFMARWNQAILAEYPQLGIFGETWVQSVTNQAYFTRNNLYASRHRATLPGVTDFQLYFATLDALTKDFGWTEGVNRVYQTLAQDVLYQDPTRNVTFLDNHDLSRYFSVVGESLDKYKMGLAFMLTTRGIPSLYYGTELLMKNFANPDGKVRDDFPGGWPGDRANKFTAAGRTAAENQAFDYVRRLANWRKQNRAAQTGNLMQYVPENGVYVYFRYNTDQTVMVVMNTNKTEQTLPTNRFVERIDGFATARDVVSGATVSDLKTVKVPALTTLVWELNR